MTTPWSPTTGVVPWRRATTAVAVAWVLTMLVVVVATGAVDARAPVGVDPLDGFGGWPVPPIDATGFELLRTGLVRFDALWYLAIAADGYPATTSVPQAVAFLPGYPSVVALVGALLGGRLVVASLVVSFVATVASVVGLQRLAELVAATHPDLDRRDVRQGTTVLALVFPTSFFLLAPYAESLLLATSVWALVLATRGRPFASAGLAAVATVTRPVGVLLVVPLLLGGVAHHLPPSGWWRDATTRRLVARRHLLPTAGVGLGGLALLVHGAIGWGDPVAVVSAQDGWQRTTTFPLVTLWDGVRYGLDALHGGATVYHLLDLLVFGLTLLGIGVLVRRREWPLVAHGVASMLLWLVQPFLGRPLMSTPRFALALPAVVIGLALVGRGDGWRRAVVPVCAVLFTVHLVLFTRWSFVF